MGESDMDHGPDQGSDLVMPWSTSIGHDLVYLAIVIGVTWAYLVAARKVGRANPAQPWPRRFTVMFLVGMGCSALVTIGPIGAWAMQRFSLHMVQHLVLMMLATPFLVMGAPVLLALRAASPQRRRRTLVPILRSRAFAIVTNPILTWILFAALLVGIHFSPLMNLLMGWPIIGSLIETGLYVGVAFAFYYTLLPGNPARNRPTPALRVLSLFLMMAPETMTGFFLYSASAPLFPHFRASAPDDASAVLDQQLGGALMWSTSMIVDVAWIAVALYEWMGSEAARTRRLDAQIAREALQAGA